MVPGARGCVVGHIDSDTHSFKNDPSDPRFQAVVKNTQNVKWSQLMPEGHEGVQGTLFFTANSDTALATAIATSFHNVISGGEAQFNKRAEGLGIDVSNGTPLYPPKWFVGHPDTWY
ncbi:MAG: hypothetical protein MMC23_003372 [Stictis urceolatum]|nr:hypothetical protein [Stictis urceolata]